MRLFLLIFLLQSLGLQAQNTSEYEVLFNSNCWFTASARSEKFSVQISEATEFIGISAYVLQEEATIDLSYRVEIDGHWSAWLSFRVNTHGETPGRTAFEADPIQQVFSKIQFRSSDSLDEPVVFRLFIPITEKKSLEITTETNSFASCACPQPTICHRNCWCPDSTCTTGYTPSPTQPTHLIIHHSAGFSNSNNYNWVVAYYWDLHVNTNGWDDVGYNWLIDPFGVIYEGRGSGVLGAHFSCMNQNTTGICLIGNFENGNPTVLAKNSLKELIAWEACNHNIGISDSSIHASSQLMLRHVSGHRDGNTAQTGCPKGTLCPGAFLYTQLPQVIKDVSTMSCLQTIGTEELRVRARVEVYPNPVKDELQIHTDIPFYTAKILDVNGRTVLETKGDGKSIPTSDLSPGVYFLQISGEKIVTKKFIKR